MSATRSGKEERTYHKYQKGQDKTICPFCVSKDEELVAMAKHFKIIRNIFAYSLWDGQSVIDHLMIVPLKHVDSVAHFTEKMIPEYHKLLSKYESKGYNTYARTPVSKIKSVVHQHTHLIKTEGDSKNFIFLLRKPFFVRLVH